MGRFFGLIAVGIVMGVGAYIYMRQAQSATLPGASNPTETVDFVGVRHDLMAIARAERTHNSLHGGYASLDELRSSGDLTMGNNRGPYTYSVETTGSGFRVIATYSGPTSAAGRNISLDQDMHFSEE